MFKTSSFFSMFSYFRIFYLLLFKPTFSKVFFFGTVTESTYKNVQNKNVA